MSDEPPDKKSIQKLFAEALEEVKKFGGGVALKSGEWLLPLIQNAFRSYYQNAKADYFRKKYPKLSDEAIIKKLISVASRNSMILGGITGAAISADEIMAIVAAAPTGGINLPAQLGIAVTALGAEAVLLIRFQLQLIAEIAKLLDVPLNPEDPEDALLVLGFAIGGSGAEFAGKAAAKAAGHLTKIGIKKHISGATLKGIQRFAAMLGQTILQRSILKYAVPGASIGVGAIWNYATTRAVGKVAKKHFLTVLEERSSTPKKSRKTGVKRASPKKRQPRKKSKPVSDSDAVVV